MPKLGNLASRVLVAVVAVPILLLAVYQDRPEFTWGIVFLATLIALDEFFAMTLTERRDRLVSLLLGAAAAAALYWVRPARGGPMLVLFLAAVPAAVYYLFRFGDMKTVASRLAYTVAGIVYVGVLATYLALIKRDSSFGGDLVVFVLLIAWVGDTGAYFAGRFLGKRKLYPEVSPGKTWAGAVGGVLGSAAAAAVMKLLRFDEWIGWVDVMAMAVPGAVLGQMGDLVESLFKRSQGVKDSGSILPGHGGMLDRIDAVLFIAPYVYLYIIIRPQL